MANHAASKQVSIRQSKQQINKVQSMMTPSYSSGFSGTTLKRIRTPHRHDVLSGRGGAINSHEGNAQFRKWVSVRKNDYNLAPNKVAKAEVAREVIALVRNQNPPGRFLQKDSTSVGSSVWWVELDDEKMMAKTSQALREGAPQIRAAHKEELAENKARASRRSRKTTPKPRTHYVGTNIVTPQLEDKPHVLSMLKRNLEEARVSKDYTDFTHVEKRPRMEHNGEIIGPEDATPPLTSTKAPTPDIIPLEPNLLPQPAVMQDRSFTRSNSLALSDITDYDFEADFVNPFDDEKELENLTNSPPRPGVLRESSISSDMGGYGALFSSNNTLPSLPSWTSAVPNRAKSITSTSSKSLSAFSDLPETTDSGVDFATGVTNLLNDLDQGNDQNWRAWNTHPGMNYIEERQ